MKRIYALLVSVVLLSPTACNVSDPGTATVRDYYQLKIYNLQSADQESRMDNYLESAYLPALHRAGIENIGVFKPIPGKNEGKNYIMVLIPFHSFKEIETLDGLLASDETYLAAGNSYIETPHDNPTYARIESILLKSFSAMPQLAVPGLDSPRSQRVYELRSYEGATEQLYQRKVEMFNDAGEVALFKELEFNPVFFGEVLSSAHMPHLMYMTTFSDTISQQEHWAAFGAHPDWLKMKELERYQNTVSSITRYLMYPTSYSDI